MQPMQEGDESIQFFPSRGAEKAFLPDPLSQRIIENSPDCIKLLDLSGRLLYMNQGGQHAMEIDDMANYRYFDWRSFWTGEGYHMADHALSTARAGRTITFEGACATAKGTPKWWEITVAPVLDSQGHISHLLSISRDMTARKQAEIALAEQARIGRLNLAVSSAFTESASLREMLTRCTQALVDHLNVTFARIWTLNEAEQVLELQASSGIYTHINGGHASVPVGTLKIGLIAKERTPHTTNQVLGDPLIVDQKWVKREGLVAFAGYPLLLEHRLLGVIAMFARHPLSDTEFAALQSISNAIAVGIERKHTELALRVSEERFRTLANQAPILIWQSDANGEIIYVNTTWCTFTGLSEEESLGNSWTNAVHPGDRSTVTDIWRATLGTHLSYHTEFRLRRADGIYRSVLVQGSPCTDQSGRFTGYIGIILDITEQKDLEQQREAFISMATHELKTPLTVLQGNIEIAQRRLQQVLHQTKQQNTEPSKTLSQIMTTLTRTQQQMRLQTRLINDLLDMSRIHAEKIEFDLHPCDLVVLTQQTVQDQQAAFPQRVITFEFPSKAPIMVLADQERIRQVLTNYLSNACKYSPQDHPVQVGIFADAASARVWVQDHGPGLSPEQQEHIWERFYQAKEIMPFTKESPGLGLGLHICQELIRGQRGDVGVESTPGEGSTFWFMLPLLQSPPS